MFFLKIITEPTILIITAFFLFFVFNVTYNYSKIEKHLKLIYTFMNSMDKKELSYRFNELDVYMTENQFTRTAWEDLKKALIFPDKIYVATKNSTSSISKPEIYLSTDASFFFNEDSLIHSKINYRFIQTMPTLLTGLGPFFTFMKMAIAFGNVDFSNMNSNPITTLVASIQIAALCSVFAVGYSLIFLCMEKILYSLKCKKYYLLIQKEFIRLFDICSSEQFLLDIAMGSKEHGLNNERILSSLPEEFAKSIGKSVGEIITPYLENILYSLNRLNEQFGKGDNGDMVDKLF